MRGMCNWTEGDEKWKFIRKRITEEVRIIFWGTPKREWAPPGVTLWLKHQQDSQK